MKDDLVRRLKSESVVWSSYCTFNDEDRILLKELCAEAAAEIERLQGELSTCRELREYDAADIERLTGVLKDANKSQQALMNVIDERKAEIERLRTQCENWAKTATEQAERIDELRAKLEIDERKPVPWDYNL